ncbi:xylulokinase [Paenibacillus sp. N3.4]|uniref:xylulokinase n=1 Tax=Paenibacillus sp. N3.4 TaxID=2603222 RepID=UPI0011C9C817|nr:xylulokinase [Paenibacillus sp. N3.4]TXK77189.1 xylulokinase [Paenibacillus sp. N3.4]
MSKTLILAHDIGTTGNKASLYNEFGEVLGSAFYGYETSYPQVGWAEQNPQDWWRAVCITSKELLAKTKVSPKEIACVTFSGQMMGCVFLDQKGRVLREAIIWADMRAEQEAEDLLNKLSMEKVYRTTGHRISSSYSGAKIMWVKRHEPEVYRQTYKILNAKDYLVYQLTGQLATDYSDASGTNVFDLVNKRWSAEIIDAWGMDADKLPSVYPSTQVIGEVAAHAVEETGLAFGTPVVIGGGDGCCAGVGVGVVTEGDAFNYIGSSAWIAVATEKPVFDPEMKTYTWAHLDPDKYSPNGTMQSAGASYQWVRDQLYSSEYAKAKETGQSIYELMNEHAAKSMPGANKLLYLPYLMGERSPRWNPSARATFLGLHMTHTRQDMTRAVMEGVAFNLKIILDTFLKADIEIDRMWVLGGGAKGKLWRQILADIYEVDISVPCVLEEATSMGAAVAGGIGIGLLRDFSIAKQWVKHSELIVPSRDNRRIYREMYGAFEEAYHQLLPIYSRLFKL